MSYTPKKYTTILQRMADRVVSRSRLTDTVAGGALWNALGAVARELDDVYFQMGELRDGWDIDKATGSDLDLRAADIPGGVLVRGASAKASTTLVFSRAGTTGTVTIPAGSVAQVPGGGPSFITSVSGSITAGNTSSAAIAALAQEAGSEGNVAINTITQLNGISGVDSVTNNTTGANGTDREGDESLRQRIRSYLKSLSRGTETALAYAALDVDLSDEGFGRVTSVQVVPYPSLVRGKVHLYIDDGNGTAGVVDDSYGSPEAVITNATGGEKRFYLANSPVLDAGVITLEVNAVGLTRGTHYRLDVTTGLVILDETFYPLGLTAADDVTCEYSWYAGLVGETQKVINGDPADRANYPGFKAAGNQVFVLPPVTTQLAVDAVVTPDPGYGAGGGIRDAVKSAIIRYVNSRGIGEDVILTELIFHAQSVPGVRDVSFTQPSASVTVGEGELIRLQASNIDIT